MEAVEEKLVKVFIDPHSKAHIIMKPCFLHIASIKGTYLKSIDPRTVVRFEVRLVENPEGKFSYIIYVCFIRSASVLIYVIPCVLFIVYKSFKCKYLRQNKNLLFMVYIQVPSKRSTFKCLHIYTKTCFEGLLFVQNNL